MIPNTSSIDALQNDPNITNSKVSMDMSQGLIRVQPLTNSQTQQMCFSL